MLHKALNFLPMHCRGRTQFLEIQLARSTAQNTHSNDCSALPLDSESGSGVMPDHAGQSADQEIHQRPEALASVAFQPTVYTRIIKPVCDRVAALIALVLLAVPMLFIVAAVCVSMGRPLLFRQRRVGLNGEVFYVLKFRTMEQDRRETKLDVREDQRLTHKTEKDPRHTRVGQFLRRYSLDELPQLFNILRGEMSVVGPRPELESIVATNYPAGLEQRHLVRPGLTGLWQISARGEGHMHENGKWDLDYVNTISPITDLRILLKTPFVMFGRNAGK